MTLTSRLLTFFLTALALVLLGFSMTLYLLARTHLQRHLDDRLGAALDTLAAAAEVGPDGVEWEAHERDLRLGQEDGADQVRWLVCDDRAQVVDRSRNLAGDSLPLDITEGADGVVSWHGQPWRLVQRQVRAPLHGSPGPSPPAKIPSGKQEPKYPLLVLTAGLSLQPVQTTLRNLALTLVSLSAGLWLLAALLGRWLCRRALIAVTRMATAARAMSAEALDQRLPSPGTGDELEELSQSFNGLLTRLQESFERQRRFTGDASHQLRTPLAAMLGQVEVALRRDRPGEEYRRVLTLVHGQALHLRGIVELLLFLARADAEARLAEFDAVDLKSWLAEHVRSWSGHARAGDLRLEDSADGPLWVKASAPLLGQLVDNLLENACKYSAPGSAVTVRLTRDTEVCLSVEDTGSGIAPADLAHIFEPFYRSAEARRLGFAGVGLGLAVARRIATTFGGTLLARNNPDRGATFTLRLGRIE